VAHEGDSKKHARLSRHEAETTAGEAMDLGSLPAAAEAAASPEATTHGPAAEELLDGAEYDAETENKARASEAAAARVRPPRPSNWGTMTKVQKGTGTSKVASGASRSLRVTCRAVSLLMPTSGRGSQFSR